MDINNILQQFTQASQQRQGQVNDMAARMDADTQRIQGLLTTNEQESQTIVSAAAEVAAAEAAVKYRTEKAKEGYTALAGMNPEDLNNQFNQSVAAYDVAERTRSQLETQRAASMRRVEQLSGANLLSNPLEYLFAQLQLPKVAAQHNSLLNQEIEAVGQRDAATRNVTARAEMIRQKDSLIAGNTADAMLDIRTKQAKNAEAAAQVQLRQATADNISKIGARALDQYRLAGDNFSLQSDMFNKLISVEQWKIAMAERAEARAERAAAASLRLKDVKTKDEMEAMLNERLAAASAALGYSEPFNVLSLKLLSQPKQDALLQVAMSGTYGDSLPQAFATINTVGALDRISTTNPGMSTFVRNTTNSLSSYKDGVVDEIRKGTLPKNTKITDEAATNYTFEVGQSMSSLASRTPLSSNKWDNNGIFNPYKPQYNVLLDAVAGDMMPELKGNVALTAVDTLRKAAGGNPGENVSGKTMENMFTSLAQQVADGSLPLDKAVQDIVVLHRTAAAKNLDMYNYTQFGLPQQTSTIIGVPAQVFGGDPVKVDLMNAAGVKLALTRMAAQKRASFMGIYTGPLKGSPYVAPDAAVGAPR